jgi:uncharacterized protein YjbI with pentapeptide repeats
MRILKPQRISLMCSFAGTPVRGQLVVTGLFGFRISSPFYFLTEQELWATIKSDIQKDEIFDLWMPKKSGELLVWGKAISEKPVKTMTVGVDCGPISRRLVVSGDRVWEKSLLGWRASTPQSFTEMPITWSRAYGGFGFAACPIGTGHEAQRRLDQGEVVTLPNIESIKQRLIHPSDVLRPVSFAATDIRWPSFQITGSFDDKWLAEQHPAMPSDVDQQIFNLAQEEQRLVNGYWRGDENFAIYEMHRSHPEISSALPGVAMRCFYTRAHHGDLHETKLRLDTVCLFPSSDAGVLIFRGEIEDVDTDARGIEALMPAAEWLENPKPISHYVDAYRLRTDDSVRMEYAMADLQLMPELTPSQQTQRHLSATQAAAKLRRDFDNRQMAKLNSAASVLGPPASAALTPDFSDAENLFPSISEEDVTLGDVDFVKIESAATNRRQQAETEMQAWEEDAQSLFSGSAAYALDEKISPVAHLDFLDQVADSLEGGEKSLSDVISSAIDSKSISAANEFHNDEIAAWMRRFFYQYSGGKDEAQTATAAIQLRTAVAQARQAFELFDGTEQNSALESVMAALPDSIKEFFGNTLGANPWERSIKKADELTSDKLEEIADSLKTFSKSLARSPESAMPINIPTNLSEISANSKSIPHVDGIAELISAVAKTGSNQILIPGLAGESQSPSPLIEKIQSKLQEAGAVNGVFDAMLSPKDIVAEHPALKHLKNLKADDFDAGDDFSNTLLDDFPNSVKEALNSNTPMSLDMLINLLDEPEMIGITDGEPDIPTRDESSDNENTSDNRQESHGNADSQLSDDAPSPSSDNFASTPATAAIGITSASVAALLKDENNLRTARQSARGAPFFTRRTPTQRAALLCEAIRKGETKGISLAGLDLAAVNLSGADLRGVDFRGAMMEGADLSKANLENTRMNGVVLSGAYLNGTNFAGADLTGANLSKVTAPDSIWSSANLSNTIMEGGNYSRALMQSVRFDECEASRADFQNADLSGSLCREGRFLKANFSGASLSEILWQDADLLEAQLTRIRAHRATMKNCKLISVCAEEADFSRASLEGAVLLRSSLPRLYALDLQASGSSWYGCNLASAVLDQACLMDVNLMEAIMSQASLAFANLKNAHISGAVLCEADLSNTQLFGASMRAVDLTGADLRGANLENADLTGAILDRCDMTGINSLGSILNIPTHV